MNHSIVYLGCFIDFATFQSAVQKIRFNPLERDIKKPHVTFEYKPKEIDRTLFGEEVKIKVIGYGNDGINEGVKVQVFSKNPTIQELYEKIEVPHITIAVSSGGKPVNTRFLKFKEIEPFELTGIYGGCDIADVVQLKP